MLGKQLVIEEYQKQKAQWGTEHDRDHHGLTGLAEVALLLCASVEPDWAREGYDESDWFVVLWRKYKDNHIHRCIIASAMLMNGVDCELIDQSRKLASQKSDFGGSDE